MCFSLRFFSALFVYTALLMHAKTVTACMNKENPHKRDYQPKHSQKAAKGVALDKKYHFKCE